jgi:CHAT domain-containing protein/Tfp pilus assembly protein PilF
MQGNYAQALSTYELAKHIAEQYGDQSGTASALRGIANIHYLQGDFVQALESLQTGLRLFQESADKAGIATTLRGIGSVHYSQGNYIQALESFQKSLVFFQELGDQAGVAGVHANIGAVHDTRGEYAQALDYYQAALQLGEALGDTEVVTKTLNNIGAAYQMQGNHAQGLDYFQKALRLAEALGDKAVVAGLLRNIGVIHRVQGNHAQALDYYQKAMGLAEALGDKVQSSDALNEIGTVHMLQGNYVQALEDFQRGLRIVEALEAKAETAILLSSMGEVYRLQANYAQALENFRRSLILAEELGRKEVVAPQLNNIGEVYLLQGNSTQALEYAERAAVIARQIGNPETLWQSLTTAGRACRALDRPAQARQALAEAIATIEDLRTQVAGGEQERQRFFEDKLSPYQQIIELLLAQNDLSEAFVYAERSKARVLSDVLYSGRINITKSMTDQEQQQELRLRCEVASLNGQLYRESLSPQPDRAPLPDLRDRLEKARLVYADFQTGLYAAHPELKVQRSEAPPITLEHVAALLPDGKSALLEFVAAEEQTYLFVLTREEQRDRQTPGHGNGAIVDPSALRPVASLSNPVLKVYALQVQRKELAERVGHFRRQLAERDLGFRASASQLYERLLGPARGQLQGKTSLVIVPDGVLWELPFQALLDGGRYLLEDSSLAYAPSLTALREMRRPHGKPASRPAAAPSLLALGNPALGKQASERVQFLYRDEKLHPLPEAEREVQSLGQLYRPAPSKVYVGAEAREERLKAEASSYSVLHLATHGVLNDASPMYSHVLLSQEGDQKEDGLLEAWELMNLDLKAELVVLSACETARGRVGAGEGVIGLSWALFVAGTPTAVVSQWKVESSSTTELMVEFHRSLRPDSTKPRSKVPKAQALRQAALKLLRGGQYAHPFYWAGFVVVGDGF